jgi:hypothetical protein
VRQILINLIDNGIKFTPDGGTVTVASRSFTKDNGLLCLSVSDTGPGISPENRELIFERLAQVQSSLEASRSGLGLGLFIARELVSQHGGRIWVESELGHGSTFCFTLPVFSLSKLCAQTLTADGMPSSVTLIAVDVAAAVGADRAEVVPAIRAVLERCIHAGLDVLLPSMTNAEPVETFFILACADCGTSQVIVQRIGRALLKLDGASTLEPVVTSTTLAVAPDRSSDEQIADVMGRVAQLVQEHLVEKRGPK